MGANVLNTCVIKKLMAEDGLKILPRHISSHCTHCYASKCLAPSELRYRNDDCIASFSMRKREWMGVRWYKAFSDMSPLKQGFIWLHLLSGTHTEGRSKWPSYSSRCVNASYTLFASWNEHWSHPCTLCTESLQTRQDLDQEWQPYAQGDKTHKKTDIPQYELDPSRRR